MKSGIIYKGPSLLDGKPIVVIATLSNRNSKTGNVVQTYILKSDTNPLEASKTGADSHSSAASTRWPTIQKTEPPSALVGSFESAHTVTQLLYLTRCGRT